MVETLMPKKKPRCRDREETRRPCRRIASVHVAPPWKNSEVYHVCYKCAQWLLSLGFEAVLR